MTKEQFDREKKYQAALAVAREMLKKGVIDEADFLRYFLLKSLSFQGGFL